VQFDRINQKYYTKILNNSGMCYIIIFYYIDFYMKYLNSLFKNFEEYLMFNIKSVIINGIARAGKDTFIKMCQEYMSRYNVYNLSTIDPIKKIVKDILKIDVIDKSDKYRKLLSDIKLSLTEYNNYTYHWIINQVNKYIEINKYETNIFFIQCREPSEIQKFKNNINSITLLVTKSDLHIPNNIADQNVLNYKYDYIIENNSTLKQLNKKAISFCEAFLI